jgi:hypothetical protein
VPTHPDDDQLLELAYGEAPASEARALRHHVDGCARCKKVMEGIAEVRSAFRSVPPEPAPERGLESLLAYGEQAAARARSRRGGLRILALLSAATAFAVVWLVSPAPHLQDGVLARAPATKQTDTLAQAEVPHAAAQGDRTRDESDDGKKDAKEELRRALPAAPPVTLQPAKTERAREEQALPERKVAEPPKQKAMAKLDAPAEQPKVAQAPAAGAPADAEAAGRSAAASDPSGGKVSTAAPNAAAGAGTLHSESIAMKKGNAPPHSGPPASVALASPPSGQTRGVDARAQQAAKIVAAPLADAVASEDKDVGAAATTSSAAARNAAKPVPPMQSMRMGAGSPEKQVRLAEIRRQLETATGDQRKSLLMEKCEIEASLQLGPDAVGTCSTVAREFPGTPEAKRASDVARGFSVQLPAREDR